MIGIILTLGSLIIAGLAAWWYLNWKSPSKQQQINKLAQEITEKDVKVEKTSDFSSLQNEVDNAIDGIDENTTDEKEKVKLAQAKELKELVESVKKDEDLASKNYFASWVNIGLAAGIFLGLWLILNWISKRIVGTISQQE
ncbi:MAG: hypothetical protein MRERV_12c015 [Mycoplasmataceae bacterium RV_VA103A]|nr:MAG: hypothetical protein MRERV_12c015 [Mycoplasmataceae bacterium RV_VA103A]